MIQVKRKLQSSARGRADILLTKHKTAGVVGRIAKELKSTLV